MGEKWLPIAGLDGFEISDHGRVRSWWRRGRNRTLKAAPHLLSGSPTKRGGKPRYLRVCISQDGEKLSKFVHQMVLEAFVGPRPEGLIALHIDGNPFNNRVENLRWGTHKENAHDRLVHGRSLLGERNHKSKLTADQVASIRAEYLSGCVTQTALADRFGVTQASINAITLGKNWKSARAAHV